MVTAQSPSVIPRHIAVIMDGNGRWARERGLSRAAGHRAGAEAVRESIQGCRDLGIEFLTVYAFSSENWARPKSEIKALMTLLEKFLEDKSKELMDWDVRLQAIGRLHDLPDSCQKQLHQTIVKTSANKGLTLILALSYGGREEIIDGVKSVLDAVREGHIDPAMITPELFSQHLYTRYFPDPDLLIRTSGEMRLSNFLLWQISYAELVVLKKNWPDFRASDLADCVHEYSNRHRRFGKL